MTGRCQALAFSLPSHADSNPCIGSGGVLDEPRGGSDESSGDVEDTSSFRPTMLHRRHVTQRRATAKESAHFDKPSALTVASCRICCAIYCAIYCAKRGEVELARLTACRAEPWTAASVGDRLTAIPPEEVFSDVRVRPKANAARGATERKSA